MTREQQLELLFWLSGEAYVNRRLWPEERIVQQLERIDAVLHPPEGIGQPQFCRAANGTWVPADAGPDDDTLVRLLDALTEYVYALARARQQRGWTRTYRCDDREDATPITPAILESWAADPTDPERQRAAQLVLDYVRDGERLDREIREQSV